MRVHTHYILLVTEYTNNTSIMYALRLHIMTRIMPVVCQCNIQFTYDLHLQHTICIWFIRAYDLHASMQHTTVFVGFQVGCQATVISLPGNASIPLGILIQGLSVMASSCAFTVTQRAAAANSAAPRAPSSSPAEVHCRGSTTRMSFHSCLWPYPYQCRFSAGCASCCGGIISCMGIDSATMQRGNGACKSVCCSFTAWCAVICQMTVLQVLFGPQTANLKYSYRQCYGESVEFSFHNIDSCALFINRFDFCALFINSWFLCIVYQPIHEINQFIQCYGTFLFQKLLLGVYLWNCKQ